MIFHSVYESKFNPSLDYEEEEDDRLVLEVFVRPPSLLLSLMRDRGDVRSRSS